MPSDGSRAAFVLSHLLEALITSDFMMFSRPPYLDTRHIWKSHIAKGCGASAASPHKVGLEPELHYSSLTISWHFSLQSGY